MSATLPPDEALFRPPPAAAQTPLVLPLPTASPTALPEQLLLPSPTPGCTDQLRFVEDVTIPDGAQVAPGQVINKQWRVENQGTCNWDDRYRLRLVQGPAMGAPEEQALYPARSGVQALIHIVFTTPMEAGRYRSAWQAYNPQGQPFGDTIYIEIVVQ